MSAPSPLGFESNRSKAHQSVLTPQQLGHIRHIDNLSRQLPNDWSLMQGKGVGQDDFGGYRFQLAYMAYALAIAHFHRLPNAPGVFKPIFERLIEKCIMPEVWSYWRDVSRGGSVFNAHVSADLQEEWDPVARDNIMYSAYVQSMALMYNYLFDDDRYAQPGALSFEHWSFFWGGEPKRFTYDQNSLNEHIYWEMVQSGYLGVACEPNCVFQICNQPAILGFRMHDLVYGGTIAAEVTRSYDHAWRDLGRLDARGHYNMMVAQDSREVRPNEATAPWVDAWCGTLMNMWNREFVHQNYQHQVKDFLVYGPEETISVRSAKAREVMGQVVVNDTCDLGWVATWASEMGDTETLDGLLKHADRFLNPQWRDGGLYYPRNDSAVDASGHSTVVEPLTGNALIAYARLNVPDGLWQLYNLPWGTAHFVEPMISQVADDIEVSQATFDIKTQTLAFRVQRHADRTGDGSIAIRNVVERATWTAIEDGTGLAVGGPGVAESLKIGTEVKLAGDLLHLVIEPGGPRSIRLILAHTSEDDAHA
jgi:hypothetical protein